MAVSTITFASIIIHIAKRFSPFIIRLPLEQLHQCSCRKDFMEVLGIICAPLTEAGRHLCLAINQQLGLLLNYRRNVRRLEKQADILRAKRMDIQNLIDEAQRRLEEPTEGIIEWLKRVDGFESDMNVWEEMIKRNNRQLDRCCGWCPSWGPRYRISREAARKLVLVLELQREGDFSVISRSLPPPTIESMPVGDFQMFESTNSAMEQIMEALQDENANVIGVFGMGGVGKTTLMKEVGKRVRRDLRYDVVLMVAVSRKPDVMRIQDEIAEKLGLKLEDDATDLRAHKLMKRLQIQRSVLVILDEIWGRLPLLDVGIPLGIDHRGSKVVIVARSADVCRSMETQRNVLVDILSEKDSWDLFKNKANLAIESSVARDVAKECGGLPLALATVGRALREKDERVWENALTQLRRSVPKHIESLHREVFSTLMLGFESIENEETKLCFLFCCLFPEGYEIRKEELTRYLMGDGVLNDVNSLEEASQIVHVLVDKLKSACLLLDGESQGCVRMHDVVRDAAISISLKGGYGFLSKVGLELTEWPNRVEDCKRISLMKNIIYKLPNRAECPRLQTLLMQNNWPLKRFPEGFFDGMKALTVLDLNGNRISSLPASLGGLKSLKTLCLQKCRKLVDISYVGQLKNLEILLLNGTKVSEIPEQFGSLVNLKLLDLSNTECLSRVPPNVISKLVCLEELYMGRSFSKWEVEGQGNGSNAPFAELASLSKLNILQCHVENVQCLSHDVPRHWRNLNKFCICVDGKYVDGASQQILRIRVSDQIANWVNLLLGQAEDLCLLSCNGVQSLIQLHAGRFNHLKSLTLKDCNEIEYLVTDVEDAPILERLKELNLDHLENFKEMYNDPLPANFLLNLQVLRINDCQKLARIFASELLCNLQNLERLEVYGRNELQEAFSYDGFLEGQALVSKLQVLKLKHLPMVTTIWKGEIPHGSLRNVEYLYVGVCPCLKSLLSPRLVQRLQRLKQMDITTCWALEKLISNEEELTVVEGRQPWPAFQNLQKLSICDCFSITKLFSMKLARNLGQLEELRVEYCPAMETVISEDSSEVGDQDHLLPQLKILVLYRLRALTSFGERQCVLDLPSLEHIKVWRCQELKRLPIGPKSLLKLEKFEVTSYGWFEQLEWEDEVIKSRLKNFFSSE